MLLAFAPFAHAAFNKPWADDPAAYLTANPRAAQVIGVSTDAAAEWQTSVDEAARDAATKMTHLVLAALQQRNASAINLAALDAAYVEKALPAYISEVTSDRVVERVDRPYGSIYSARLLVDASPAAVSLLADRIAPGARQITHRTWLTVFGRPLVMIGVVFFVCTILNFLTKGYYRGRLLVVAGMIGVVLFVASVFLVSARPTVTIAPTIAPAIRVSPHVVTP